METPPAPAGGLRGLIQWGWNTVQKGEKYATLPLRGGLAALFLIEAHSKIASMGKAGSPLLMRALSNITQVQVTPAQAESLTLYVFGMGELLLGLMFLLGAFTRYASAAAAGFMALTVGLFGIPTWSIGILKDTTILGAALAQGLLGSYVLSVDGLLRKKHPKWMI